MPQDTKAEHLARVWIDCWNAGKPDDIPLASDFTHSSPFGTVNGREKYLAWVKPLAAKNVVTLKIIKTLGRGNEAVIWFEMTTPDSVVPCCDWLRIQENNILTVTSFYDASTLK